MNFINIPSNKYLFQYQIKFENKLIGHSLVSYIDDVSSEYLLEIKIINKEDAIHFGKILRQSSYKFINLISGKKMQNSKLYLLLPNDSLYEILTAMSEYFIQDKTIDENILNYLKTKLIYDKNEDYGKNTFKLDKPSDLYFIIKPVSVSFNRPGFKKSLGLGYADSAQKLRFRAVLHP